MLFSTLLLQDSRWAGCLAGVAVRWVCAVCFNASDGIAELEGLGGTWLLGDLLATCACIYIVVLITN